MEVNIPSSRFAGSCQKLGKKWKESNIFPRNWKWAWLPSQTYRHSFVYYPIWTLAASTYLGSSNYLENALQVMAKSPWYFCLFVFCFNEHAVLCYAASHREEIQLGRHNRVGPLWTVWMENLPLSQSTVEVERSMGQIPPQGLRRKQPCWHPDLRPQMSIFNPLCSRCLL